MAKVQKLTPLLISKIAAGEVIERPSFAVKELIENAIDAKATEISVYIEESGLSKIQIVDNGEGMSQEDVLESWKPHTTSKLQDESDLHAIKSFGFRGEALSSLTGVSKLTIRSRVNNDILKIVKEDNSLGFEILVENGKLLTSSPVGMAPGTVVIAENLFASIPARKKFLKSPQTELRHIIDVVNHFAVAHPRIRFRLTHGKRTLFDYPPTKDVSERIEQLVGSDAFSFFIPVNKSESYISLSGFIAKPQLNTTTQNKQFVFVNARKVNAKLISQAVKESFGTMLESTTYPLFVLFLNLPFEMVDVNVHPRKEQVSFINNQFIFQTVKQCITEVLEEHNLTFQNLSWKRTGVGMTKSYAGTLLKESVLDKESFGMDQNQQFLQLNKLYILIPTKSGLLLFDQHAAHERVLFEKLKNEFAKQKNSQQTFLLPNPIRITLTNSERILVEEHKNTLEELGFGFKKSSLTHLPFLFQDRDPKELFMSILERLNGEKGLDEIDKVSEEMLAFLACRAAVKAGDTLTNTQMKHILKDLEITSNNVTCPHGRPTRIHMSLDQLNTLFKR